MRINQGVLLFLLISCLQDAQGVDWTHNSLRDGATVYACRGANLALLWDVNVQPGAKVVLTEWTFSGHSDVIVAMMSHGVFNPMPSYAGRVQLSGMSGVEISNVTDFDAGNYSVTVTTIDASGGSLELTSTASVEIGDGLAVENGTLQAALDPTPALDNVTQELHLTLTCGQFTYTQHPPFSLEWTTPSGQSMNSTGYENGRFHLQLPNPIEGGVYGCGVPLADQQRACIGANSSAQNASVTVDAVELQLPNPTEGGVYGCGVPLADQQRACIGANSSAQNASVTVDELQARLALLEANNAKVREDFAKSDKENTDALQTQITEIRTTHVGFATRGISNNNNPHTGEALRPQELLLNQGGGFNLTSGTFVAPVNGTYFLSASLVVFGSRGTNAFVGLLVDGKQQVRAHTMADDSNRSEAVSVAALVRLQAGAAVWLLNESDLGIHFRPAPEENTFSGFLVSPDP